MGGKFHFCRGQLCLQASCSAPETQPGWWGESLGSIFTLIAVWIAVKSCRAEGGWVKGLHVPCSLPWCISLSQFSFRRKTRHITKVLKPTQGVFQFVLGVTQQSLVLGLNWCDSKATRVTLTPVCPWGWEQTPEHQDCPLCAAGTAFSQCLLCGAHWASCHGKMMEITGWREMGNALKEPRCSVAWHWRPQHPSEWRISSPSCSQNGEVWTHCWTLQEAVQHSITTATNVKSVCSN